MQLREVTFQRFEEEAQELGVCLPIEQTSAWARLEATIEGRSQWGCFRITEPEADGGEKTVAFISFADYLTHGYHYLRAHHAPVWVEGVPTPEQESEALDAIASYVRRRDRKVAFVRLAVASELPQTSPVLSGIPYDNTVVVDLTGGDEAILDRMKTRGRRDVRKALRESPVTCADETERATECFDEYYDVMVETAERDGFNPAPKSDYQDMIRILGPEHCRVFAGRDPEGKVVTWAISTISGTHAVYYYAASRGATKSQFVTDKLFYFECCELGRRGCTQYDLMGIGSDFSPALLGLNMFKTKFAKEVTVVAPDRDLPVKRGFYNALQSLQSVRRSRREAARAKAAEAQKARPREDLLPVILGGDISAYAYGREFHEAFHVRSHAMNQAFVGALEHSALFDFTVTSSIEPAELRQKISALAEANPAKKLPVIPSTDALVASLEQIRDELPANVVLPIPTPEAFARVCDKRVFQEACERLGLPTPATEVVSLAGPAAPAPCGLPFPVVAKPARTAEYSHLYEQGFKKIYSCDDQAALDALWASLRDAGFAGDFLVQERIDGDDTHMGALTFYVGANGQMQAFGAAQALLEDHAPTMRGNSVAMVSRVWPDLMERCQRLVAELGYTGLGEVDVKRDPRTGEWLFLELNPRAGRNSYYMAAAGVNPMRAMVTDLVDGRGKKLWVADEPALYTLVPQPLLERYIADPALLAEVRDLVAQGRSFDPQRYDADRGLRRMLDVELTEKNQIRKFARFYPERTDSSF